MAIEWDKGLNSPGLRHWVAYRPRRFVAVVEARRGIAVWSELEWWSCGDADLIADVLDGELPPECLLDLLIERYDNPVLREVAEAFAIPVGDSA